MSENTIYEFNNEPGKKRIKDKNSNQEVIIEIDDDALKNTKLVREGVQNIMMTVYSRLLEDRNEFSIYSRNLKSLILAKKDRTIENKTVVRVYSVIDGEIMINSGIVTVDIEERLK